MRTSWPAATHESSIERAIGFVHDHALGEQTLEGLVQPDMAGLPHRANEEAAIEQMQDRMLDAANILVDRQVATLSTSLRGMVGDVSTQGSVKRAKYQDESTKVSIVSVSRRAGPPHCGQGDVDGWSAMTVERIARLVVKVTSSGNLTGRSSLGTGTTPQESQWITGIGQPQ